MVCRGAQCSADDGDRREERNSTDATTKWNLALCGVARGAWWNAGVPTLWLALGVTTYWLGKRSKVGGRMAFEELWLLAECPNLILSAPTHATHDTR